MGGFESVNARTVKKVKDGGYGTVLYGDGRAINGAFCDRFRIRFKTNEMGDENNPRNRDGFFVGFVHSEAAAVDMNNALGCEANKEHSVGIEICDSHFYRGWDPYNTLPSPLY